MTELRLPDRKTAASFWQSVSTRFLPFADVATQELPLSRLLRLSLFQVSVGMAMVLLTGTLNRVMIVELGVPTSLVALMVAIPVLAAPFRVLMGHRSDSYKSLLGWRRVPYIWLGTMLQFGGLAIMPFALLLLQSQTVGPEWAGPAGAALAFLLTGIGMHMAQTAGLALATDLATEDNRPRVVALVYVMLLIGMIVSALAFGWLLSDFNPMILIQVVQGAAVVTIALNVIALWKQEPRNPQLTRFDRPEISFADALRGYSADDGVKRLMFAIAFGSAGFAMQDVLLEPYGGEVLGLSVSQTTLLTALWATGALIGFAIAARIVAQGKDMYRLAAIGALLGVVSFSCVVFADPLGSANLFRVGTFLIGLGGGIFSVATMLACMQIGRGRTDNGVIIGAWGAVQATATGLGLAFGGFARDAINTAASHGFFGAALTSPSAGYSVVYHIEIGLLFTALVFLGPLVGTARNPSNETSNSKAIGLADLPG
ncbi:MAG: BCD family MFS transporter [Pseudomonadota bacterium]